VPYRSQDRSQEARRLTFFHARFYAACAFAVLLLMALMGCVTTPRTVTVQCEPSPGPVVKCTSFARSLWGRSAVLESRIEQMSLTANHEDSIAQLDVDQPDPERARPGHFKNLLLGIEYTKPWKGELNEAIRGSFSDGVNFTRITEAYPRSGDLLDGVFQLEDRLRAGKRAELVYRSGWGGLTIAVPLLLVVVTGLWLISGSSSVIHHVGQRRIETRTKNYWHSRAQLRNLEREDVQDAVITAAPTRKGSIVYRPALRLANGDLVDFGIVGATSPARPEHLVRQLRELLELPDAPVATVERGTLG
jgi:hypothetical protein